VRAPVNQHALEKNGGSKEPESRTSGLRLLLFVAPVSVGAAVILVASGIMLATEGIGASTWLRLATLLLAALFVEAFPVPIKGVRAGGISLAAVFIVAAACLYGWEAAAILAGLTRAAIEVAQRRPGMKIAYNTSVYAVSGAAAGLIGEHWVSSDGIGVLALRIFAAAGTFYALNVILVAVVVSIASGANVGNVVAQTVESTAVAFAIMASVTMMLDVLWQRSPLLALTLVGPLLATSMYQRSVHHALEAMELALTDPLSGLGNHRHFQQELERLLDEADETGTPLTLCLLDVDEFKTINDRHGHPVGDRVLAVVGECLRDAGAAFRLGGDEFAVFLQGGSEADAIEIAARAVARISRARPEKGLTIAVSAGLATYPAPGLARADLVRVADRTLYAAKAEGKAAVRAYRPGVIELSAHRAAGETDRRARLRAAASLASAIDVRDAYTGSHSHAVGELAARIGARLGLSAEEVELLRIAGRLHDLGKLAVAEDILSKPGPLTADEREAIAMHPRVGYRMLSSLRIEPVATWVLHHHERWDGSGYPEGLSGEEIPIGSRILFVADAYEAITADRRYRPARSEDDALAEILRCAGSQFDPLVVGALVTEVGVAADYAAAVEAS
jgi:diguanylate cyclase (GGDEF)-like protein